MCTVNIEQIWHINMVTAVNMKKDNIFLPTTHKHFQSNHVTSIKSKNMSYIDCNVNLLLTLVVVFKLIVQLSLFASLVFFITIIQRIKITIHFRTFRYLYVTLIHFSRVYSIIEAIKRLKMTTPIKILISTNFD